MRWVSEVTADSGGHVRTVGGKLCVDWCQLTRPMREREAMFAGSLCWLGGNRYAVLPLTLTSDLGGVQYPSPISADPASGARRVLKRMKRSLSQGDQCCRPSVEDNEIMYRRGDVDLRQD